MGLEKLEKHLEKRKEQTKLMGEMYVTPYTNILIERGIFFGAIQGMLDDLPKNKREQWKNKLSELQRKSLIPTMDWCDDSILITGNIHNKEQ